MPTTYAIPDGRTVMAATTYTGTLTAVGSNQSVSNAVNGVSFQPDFVWVKNRSSAADNILSNSITYSSPSSNNYLVSNTTAAQASDANTFRGFNTDGFNVGYYTVTGASGQTYVGWQWKAGGTSVSNTNGSITSTVSVGATQGFSVVTYTGNGSTGTIGHGLGVAPSMIIVKVRSTTNDWGVGHASVGWTQAGLLNLTNSFGTSSYFNSTSPTSSVFSVGSSVTNTNAATYVAYCFAAVAGYSAFGSYTGNGSTDGPFVYMGFRPRWFMSKRSDTSGNDWVIMDTSRDTYNVANQQLYADLNLATETNVVYETDFLSNGLKIRTSTASRNASGSTYIYAAFAENPFKYANAR